MYINLTNQKDLNFPENFDLALEEFFRGEPREQAFICEDVFQSMLFPLQRKKELYKMLTKAMELNPVVVGEIGSDKGGSLYHWAKLPTVKRVYGCEYRGVPFAEHFEKYIPDRDFCFVSGSSYDLNNINEVKKWLSGDLFDCLFLDGDKANFYKDYLLYKPLVRKGGIMFLHDINGEPPEEAFNAISKIERTEKIIDTSEGRLPVDFIPKNSWEEWLKYWGETSCGVGVVYL